MISFLGFGARALNFYFLFAVRKRKLTHLQFTA